MSRTILALIEAVDDLYRSAVEDPGAVGDVELGEWMEGIVGGGPLDRGLARPLRRAARQAGRLARYWSSPERALRSLPDWRSAVDEALGSRGWLPALAIARRGLEIDPSPQLYEETRRRFRAVHFSPWMEGVSYEEFLEGRNTGG